MPRALANELASRYAELEPWPEVKDVLRTLSNAGVPLGVVTNCSQTLGRIAADRVGIAFTVFVTAERAGYYKPQPQPYRLALNKLRVKPDRCLFVAGSAYDLFGTARVGLPTWWHNRTRMPLPDNQRLRLFARPISPPSHRSFWREAREALRFCRFRTQSTRA